MAMDFLQQLGPVALGSRLRRLSEHLTGEALGIYTDYGLRFQPRWYPVFYLVAQRSGITSQEIAEQIGHTHASVSQIVKELVRHGLLTMEVAAQDQRRRLLKLTPAGHAVLPHLRVQTEDVRRVMQALLAESSSNLWQALAAFEEQLRHHSLRERVSAVRAAREASPVVVRDFRAGDQPAFRALNVDWIERHFALEPADLKALDQPEQYILAPGGCILLAEMAGQVIGACALLKQAEDRYELAKMAVSPAVQGRRIGLRLGEAVVQRARELGAQRVYLESNSKLTAALGLYHKLGFQHLPQAIPSPYARADVQMELVLH
jgi:DNA-binding MarR family transcriptional regulator/GNAT superfamily N-acetyltransferase